MKKKIDFTNEWIKHIKNNPDWRKEHNAFINSQINNANKKLKKTNTKKLQKIFNIKNKKIIKNLTN